MTDPEIDAVFRQMQALKVGLFCTNQTRVTMAARMVPFADKYKIKPAWHPHDNIDSPVEVATAATLEKLLAMTIRASKQYEGFLRVLKNRIGQHRPDERGVVTAMHGSRLRGHSRGKCRDTDERQEAPHHATARLQ